MKVNRMNRGQKLHVSTHVCVVGGGMLGLTVALRLRARGHRVTVWEAGDHPGGLAAPWWDGPIAWDRFYHVILASDAHLRSLLAEVGLADALRWGVTRTGFYCDGRLHSMSDALEFLRFPPLRMVDKLRLGATIAYASRVRDWRRLEQIPVDAWLRRLSGRRTFEKIWRPLLQAKLGPAADEASAAFIWATIQRMYAARRSGLKQEQFGYVEGGYRTILDRLVEVAKARGIELVCGRPATAIERAEGQVTVAFAGGAERFDAVVATTSCRIFAALCPQLTPAEQARLARVRYLGVVCASMLLDRPLSPYYVTNITDPSPFTGIIEMTTLVDPATFGGRSLVYLPQYMVADDPRWRRDDAEVRAVAEQGLRALYPSFDPAGIRAFRVARARDVMAIPTRGYSIQCAPPIACSVPGICLINGAQIVNGTLNVDETVALADRGAATVAGLLEGR